MTDLVSRPFDEQLEHLTVAERNARNAKLSSYAERPLAFLLSYIRRHPIAHAVVLASVFAAVGCALASQYAIKHLIDVLAAGRLIQGRFGRRSSILVGAHCLRQPALARRRLGGRAAFVKVTGDSAARPVPVPERAFAHLFRRKPAWHAREPHHGDVERRVYVREHDGVERPAALHRGDRRDRHDRQRQSADGV